MNGVFTFSELLEALASNVYSGMSVEEFTAMAIKNGWGPIDAANPGGMWVNYAMQDSALGGVASSSASAASSATASASELWATAGATSSATAEATIGSTITASSGTMTATATATEVSSLPTAFESIVAEEGSAATVGTAGSLLGTSLPVAFAALAPVLGVGVGVGLYKSNPTLWSKISSTLLPFCYPHSDKVQMLMDDKGQTYYPEDLLKNLKMCLNENGVYEVETTSPGCTTFTYGGGVYRVFTDFKQVASETKGLYKLVGSTKLSISSKPGVDFYPTVNPYFSSSYYYVNPTAMAYVVYKDTSGKTMICILNLSTYQADISSVLEKIRQATSIGYYKEDGTFHDYESGSSNGTYSGYQVDSSFPEACYSTITGTNYTMFAAAIKNGEPGENIDPVTKLKDGFTWVDPNTDYLTSGYKNIVTGTNEDGSLKTTPYVPVRLPSSTDGSSTSTKENSQTNEDKDNPGMIDPNLLPYIITAIKNMTDPEPNPDYDPSKDPSQEPDPDGEGKPNTPTKDPVITVPPDPPDPDDEGKSPNLVDPPAPTTSGLLSIYNPTLEQVKEFGKWLWTTWSGDLKDTLSKLFNSPMDGIIGLHMLYATPSDGTSSTIKCGYLDSGIESKTVVKQFTSINCGSLIIPEWWGNYLDYAPYTVVHCYLPFIGIVQLDPQDVIGAAVNIEYKVDALTGSCIAMITVAKDNYSNMVYQYSGNCATEIPITSGNYSSMLSTAAGVVAAGIATAVTKGKAAPMIAGGVATMANGHTDVQHSSSFGATHGAMGIKKPYIIVKRPVQKVVRGYNKTYGYPAHKLVKVSECSGYLRAKEVDVISTTATDKEKAMIEKLLKTGVFV